jgi:anti-sigma factor RsiW
MTTEHEEAAFLSALLDGELEGPERVRLQKHLSSCPSCSLELEALRKVKMVLAKAPKKSMPLEWTQTFPQALTAAASPRKTSSRARVFSQSWLIPALVAAAVSFAVSFWIFQSRENFPLRHSLSLNAVSAPSTTVSPLNPGSSQTQDNTP